ncbi:HNH endonuclease [Jongsikchunia kroppenstedtii]|uniref:HNH endonuclease n=1 Tax=Jongsikchunia kroppenstedtii TaxID=1121721 RepID=UPI0003638DEF|nr:HNH endonuclease [Jongsikchunia kroppenstedtii]
MPTDVTDRDCVDALTTLVELEAATAATKMRLMVRLEQERKAARRAAGVRERKIGEGIAAEIGLAIKQSPHKAAQLLSVARRLTMDLPRTFDALQAGVLTEPRAETIARETAILDPGDAAIADHNLCADQAALIGKGDKEIDRVAKAEVYRLDPRAVVDHNEKRLTDRRVWTKPLPGALVQLSAQLPLKDGIAAYATLLRDAKSAATQGDERTQGQIMADLMSARLSGGDSAATIPVAVEVVVPVAALVDGADTAADIGGRTVPAETARRVIADALDDAADVSLRRLFADAETGSLVAMESRARCFPDGLRRFLTRRDAGVCRTPYCGAPVRHADHTVPHHAGGPTDADNGAGRCARCNQAKEADGWTATVVRGGRRERHRIEIVTPTGHAHNSTAPPICA